MALLAVTVLAQSNPQSVSQEELAEVRKAAEKGDVSAQLILGLRYHKGEGVLQDHAEAAKWYRKAAEQGDSNAQHNLGVHNEKRLPGIRLKVSDPRLRLPGIPLKVSDPRFS